MRIMTFNLRFDNERDGENSWNNRKDLVIQMIEKFTPSILGTQEGTMQQLLFMRERLPDYAMHEPARSQEDHSCQYPTLFYRVEELDLLTGSEFWLSRTPRVHRSKDWDSAFPRMMSYALFADRHEGRRLWAVVTHLDHLGVEARQEQAKMIAEWISTQSEPVILMGDFNAVPGSTVHDLLVDPATGLQDTWQMLIHAENHLSMTHHGFVGVPQRGRLDWILVTGQFRATAAVVVRDRFEGRYPSDHYPYFVDLDWK